MILVDVASCVVSSLVVDGEDERGLFPSRGWLLMDRHLLFVVGRLIALFCGCSSTSRGRAFEHITQQHCGRHDVLACSGETTDGLLRLFVSDDLPMYLSSPSADTFSRQAGQVLLEDLFKQNKALAILIELCFELA